jgi:hypothetical protein
MLFEIRRDAKGAGYLIQAPDRQFYFANHDSLADQLSELIDDPDQPAQKTEPEATVPAILNMSIGDLLRKASYRDDHDDT